MSGKMIAIWIAVGFFALPALYGIVSLIGGEDSGATNYTRAKQVNYAEQVKRNAERIAATQPARVAPTPARATATPAPKQIRLPANWEEIDPNAIKDFEWLMDDLPELRANYESHPTRQRECYYYDDIYSGFTQYLTWGVPGIRRAIIDAYDVDMLIRRAARELRECEEWDGFSDTTLPASATTVQPVATCVDGHILRGSVSYGADGSIGYSVCKDNVYISHPIERTMFIGGYEYAVERYETATERDVNYTLESCIAALNLYKAWHLLQDSDDVNDVTYVSDQKYMKAQQSDLDTSIPRISGSEAVSSCDNLNILRQEINDYYRERGMPYTPWHRQQPGRPQPSQ